MIGNFQRCIRCYGDLLKADVCWYRLECMRLSPHRDLIYRIALSRIDELMNARPGTEEGKELTILVNLIELYEKDIIR